MNDQGWPADLNSPIPKVPLDHLGRFIAGLAHDLRNPLTVIRNAVYFLRRSTPRAPEIAEFLEMIDAETQEIDAILSNLNEIVHGRDLEPAESDLESLASEIASEVDPGRATTWRFDLSVRPFMIWCDRELFRQVLRHLLRNAVMAIQGAGEILVIARHEPAFDLIEVRDTGTGIADEVRATLFEPLVSTKDAGMGLGLTFCREIIQRHRGEITLAHSSPAGAAFRIQLPRPMK